MKVRLTSRPERDLRRLDATHADGVPRGFRLRVGEHRVLYRRLDAVCMVERVVDRRDLERAVATLYD